MTSSLPILYRERQPLTLQAWPVPDEPVPFAEAVAGTYEPVAAGTRWGRAWSTLWLHVQGAVPAGWREVPGTRVEVAIDLGFTGGPGFNAEGLAWRPDGTIIKAISPDNTWLPVDSEAIDFYLEAAANPDVGAAMAGGSFRPTLLGDKATAGEDPLYELRAFDVVLLDLEVWELLRDIWTLRGLMTELSGDGARRYEILHALSRMVDVVDPIDVAGTASEGRRQLADVLAAPAAASAHRMVAVGHAHIDSAWLWPLRETVRKVARTWSNVADLADRDPDFVFACSSAQQYAWMKEHYPALFERIRGLVARGQFAPVGGMWVESDTNMPGGEAMARQFVAGKQFFLDEFGVETEEVWLPGLLRLLRGPAADRGGVGLPLVPDPEDLLEPGQQDAAPHLLVGGHRRHPGLHPLPAGRHLQLRHLRSRARQGLPAVRREGRREPVAAAVRAR